MQQSDRIQVVSQTISDIQLLGDIFTWTIDPWSHPNCEKKL